MEITKNTAVTISYRFYDASTTPSADEEPITLTYLHGVESILPGIAQALEGKKEGDEVNLTLEPKDAYGERQDMPLQRVPIKHLVQAPKRLRPGMIVRVSLQDGQKDATVAKVGKFNVDVDFNHPFAGMTLKFDITVKTVREATASEIDHGHAHGVGGHHH